MQTRLPSCSWVIGEGAVRRWSRPILRMESSSTSRARRIFSKGKRRSPGIWFMTRNSSVHAAGVVIGPEPLINLLPLKQDEDGTIVTQYAMNPVGELGLLKMDFLGLKTLTVIRSEEHTS